MEPLLVKLFAVNVPAIELVLEGTAIYLLLFVLFRHLVRRDAGSFGVADMLVLALIAEASQNTMTGEFTTLSEGAILAGTILAWNLLHRLTLVLRHRLAGRSPHGTVFADYE